MDPSLSGRFWQAVRSRQDGALFALLRDRATARHLLAGCTHLFWDPRFPDIKARALPALQGPGCRGALLEWGALQSALPAVARRSPCAVVLPLWQRCRSRQWPCGATWPTLQAAQAALLCKAAARFLRRQPALRLVPEAELAAAMPTMIAGDFNSLPRKVQSDAFDRGEACLGL